MAICTRIRRAAALCALCFLGAVAAFADDGPLSSPYEDLVAVAVRANPGGEKKDRAPGAPLGGIVPHHDLAIDMIVRFYEELSRHGGVRRVFLFAPDHFRRARRWAAVCPADWRTGDGLLSADTEAIAALGAAKIVELRRDLFASEHGVTLHIPLVARFFPDATVVPIVLRPDIPDLALLSLRRRLSGILRDGDILLLSMDLSHYKPPEAMEAEDHRTLDVLTNLRAMRTHAIDVDAPRAASLVLALLRERGATCGEVLERTDSSALMGERVESGTSYATVVYRR
ncbi:AmmeMemoRadiSam system protein B [Synergistaceae bacterium OttesenSCG-928-I11]|nr:AmmeMemoRadiSam system protein B [Synergistaceae bacterium OttesenSCG-928-I11]